MKKIVFLLLCLEGAVLSFNVAAAAALIPSISSTFGMPQFYIGKIIWLYMLPYGIAALLYGPLIRTINAKHIELTCLTLFSLANIMAAVSGAPIVLFTARFFMGLFGAAIIPLALILISHNTDSKRRGRYVGFFFSSTFVASLLGLFLSGIISWRLIFLIPGIAGIILLSLMVFYFPSFKENKQSFRLNYLFVLSHKRIFNLFFYIFCISMLYHAVQQWLGVFFSTQYKLTQFMISMLITAGSFSGIFGEALGGVLSDKIGRIKTVNLGIILMMVVVFSLFYPKAAIQVLFLLMVAWGLGWTFNHSGLSTMLTDLPRDHLYEASSLNSSVRFLSGGIGAVLGGFLMQISFGLTFIIFGACLGLLFLCTRGLLERK